MRHVPRDDYTVRVSDEAHNLRITASMTPEDWHRLIAVVSESEQLNAKSTTEVPEDERLRPIREARRILAEQRPDSSPVRPGGPQGG